MHGVCDAATRHVHDSCENGTRHHIDEQSVRKCETSNSVLKRSIKTNPVQSLRNNYELQSPGLVTSRSENVSAMPGIVKRPRDQPVGKSSKSSRIDNNYIGDCTNAKNVPVDHRSKNSEIIMQNFVCSLDYCSARFSTTKNLEYHQKCHNASTNTSSSGSSLSERMTRCPECLELSPTWNTLRLHLWAQHDIDVELFSCSECAFRTDTVQKLHAHQSTHSADKPHCCRVCGLGFECNVECLTHANEHKREFGDEGEGKVRGNIVCDTCGTRYANQHVLKNHIEDVHNKRKPFTCSICGHSSSRKHMWLAHLRTHTGEKPYRCDMCNYSTSDHNSLRRHKMRHTGKTSYKCVHCDYACIQSIQLKTHLKRKHPGMNDGYACVECRYSTVSRRNWLVHQRKCAGNNNNAHSHVESTVIAAKV